MSTRTLSEERVADLVHDATAAPSLYNAQPWRFHCLRGERTFEVRADPGRGLPHTDPDARGLHIGCGAAVLNLRVAAAHAGWRPETRLLPDPRDPALLATVHLVDPDGGESDLAALYPAVRRRHTSRRPYAETRIPEAVRSALARAARREGALLDFPSPRHLRWVLELTEEAEARNRTDPGRREDLARWARTGPGTDGPTGDGGPARALGPRTREGSVPVRDHAGARRTPGRGSADFERSPQLALLSTLRDRPEDWLRAGQAMERVLLLATSEGLVGSPVTQAVEWPDLRWPLRDPVSGKGLVQVVLRLGYGPPGPETPRRPLPEILDVDP
ncbi:Acg family FMN-binding oxidoreductase [Streptomyces macrosporus]|uniref:Nitroreductase n=1 Tax=Streptomyces macrosporus TaxID=44032 RepID=A0ABN3JPI9_9ACTN